MKKSFIKKIVCFVMLMVMVFYCAFGSHDKTKAATKGKKIIMNQSKLTLTPGSKFQLKVKKIKPAKSGKGVTYQSNRKKVVTVSKRGIVKAKGVGKAKIVIVSKKNKSIKTTVTVMVQKVSKGNKKSSSTAPALGTKNTGTPATSGITSTPSTPPKENNTEGIHNLQEMYFSIILKEFSLMVDDGTVNWIALDLTGSKNLLDLDKQALTGLISEKYGKETIQKTKDELKKEGKYVEDDMYGFNIKNGILIRISETEKNSSGFSFAISCFLNGLNTKHFVDCRAALKDDKWTYQLGGKIQA